VKSTASDNRVEDDQRDDGEVEESNVEDDKDFHYVSGNDVIVCNLARLVYSCDKECILDLKNCQKVCHDLG